MTMIFDPHEVKKASAVHPYSEFDVSSKEFWSKSFNEREETFRVLRRDEPVGFHPPTEVPFSHEEQGFWAVTRADDIAEVARTDDVFISGMGITADAYPWEEAASMMFFHGQDGALHQRNRALVGKAFTPKQVAGYIKAIQESAKSIVDDIIGAGDIDFVEAVAARLPAVTGAQMMGIAPGDQADFTLASNRIIGKEDPKFGIPDDPARAIAEAKAYLYDLGRRLAADRRRNPGDDLISKLVEAEWEGERLSDDDIGGFTLLMSVAANDTTKHSTSHVLRALLSNPDQMEWLKADYSNRIGIALPEFVRYASPVIHHARTVTRDVEFRGQQMSRGDKVVMFYSSGNRDEARFDDPMKFDLQRSPNAHVSFGGGGVHYCLGNRLAFSMLQSIYEELLFRTTIELTGEPTYLVSNTINGINALPVHVR